MSEMVERVTRAMCAAMHPYNHCVYSMCSCSTEKGARAAITAMRSRPPNNVLRAGWDARSVKDNALDAVNDIWQAMIDEALK